MRFLGYLACGFAIVFVSLFFVPIIAMAEMHEIVINPPQICGLHCLIQSAGFDTKEEADQFWKDYNGPGHEPYRINGCNLWFVDYQIVED